MGITIDLSQTETTLSIIQIARCSGNQHKSESRTSLLLHILSIPFIPVYNWHSFKGIDYSPPTNPIFLFSLFVETNTVFCEFRLDDVIISLFFHGGKGVV